MVSRFALAAFSLVVALPALAGSFPHHVLVQASLGPDGRDTGGGVGRAPDLLVRLVTPDASFVYYQELHCDVPVIGRDGRFEVRLGTVDPALNPLDLDFSEVYWLSVLQCPDESACASMEPRFCNGPEVLREPLSAVGYAYRALHADEADRARFADDCDRLDGHDASDFMPAGTDLWVDETGDAMTGPLTLPGDPTEPMHAATKQYVDRPRPDLGVPPGYSIVGETTASPPGFSYRGERIMSSTAWRKRADGPLAGPEVPAVACAGTVWMFERRFLWRWDEGTDTWSSPFAPLPVALEKYSVGAANGRIYVLGGRSASGDIVADTWEYDPASDAWQARAPMPLARERPLVAELGGRLHVIGGRDSAGAWIRTHDEYDPAGSSWQERARGGWAATHSLAAVGGRLYAVGVVDGLATCTDCRHVEAWDPAIDAWVRLDDAPVSLYAPACASDGDALYCVPRNRMWNWGAGGGVGGGPPEGWQSGPVSWLRLEPASGEWEWVPGPTISRLEVTIVSDAHRVHVLAGEHDDIRMSGAHEVFTPPGLLYLHRKD